MYLHFGFVVRNAQCQVCKYVNDFGIIAPDSQQHRVREHTMPIRELNQADLPTVLDLCQRALPLDTFSAQLIQRHMLDEPERNPVFQFGFWEGDELRGVLLGGTRRIDDGHTLLHRPRPVGVLKLIATDPAYRRQGIASQLITALIERMRDAGLTWLRSGNFAPSYFWPGVDARYTPALCFLQRHGFQRKGDAVNMAVDLHAHTWDTADDEERLLGVGIRIRRAQPSDADAFGAWLGQAWGPIWQWEGLRALHNQPPSAFVAERDGEFCAFAAYNTSSFPHVFGPTGTVEAQRAQGIGRVLLCLCLRDLRDAGCSQAEIGWVGPIAFYARVADATINRVFFWHEREL